MADLEPEESDRDAAIRSLLHSLGGALGSVLANGEFLLDELSGELLEAAEDLNHASAQANETLEELRCAFRGEPPPRREEVDESLVSMTHPSLHLDPEEGEGARIVLVEDDPVSARSTMRSLRSAASRIRWVSSFQEAMQIDPASLDLLISDVHLDDTERFLGLAVCRRLAEARASLPIVVMTGSPDVRSAMEAIDFRATRYLVKPVARADLRDAVTSALGWARFGAIRHSLAAPEPTAGDDAALRDDVAAALPLMELVWQPILRTTAGPGRVIAEALLRDRSGRFGNPGEFVEAAHAVGLGLELGRGVRRRAAATLAAHPGATAFVNLHPAELGDPDLRDPSAPLSAHASRVVLEVTERSQLPPPSILGPVLRELRSLGFSLAVDDVGAGYSSLSSVAALQPEFVKLDMSLVRGAQNDPVRQRLIRSLIEACSDLGVQTIAEGVETLLELRCMIELGATHVQGYLLGRPHPEFPASAQLPTEVHRANDADAGGSRAPSVQDAGAC